MNNIYVFGDLADIVGKSHVVANVSNLRELVGYLSQYGKRAVKDYLDDAYILFGNDISNLKALTPEISQMQFGDNDIYVVRDIEGEAPAVFTAFAAVLGSWGLAAAATTITMSMLTNLAVSLAMSAISSMLSSSPDSPEPNSNTTDNNPSTFFDGAVNQQVQGAPVPIVYGHCRCSSIVIATQILTEQTSSPT